MLDVGCWMLDAGCWMLDAGCWMLDAGCWIKKYKNKVLPFSIWTINKKNFMNYKDLQIWKIAYELVDDIHKMTISDLPGFEQYETGRQIRRSIKSVKSNIVEGYGRRKYKQEFLHFLTVAIASNDETIDHLETLYQTKSLKDEEKYKILHMRIEELGKKLNLFIKAVEIQHRSSK